ncbi:MAG: PEP-CTERM sorting domain-containing protein [Planctomycetota bacterium]|nr:PEP-CTERM sorting domain-containing protein [Planctomycetota bacterium]
MRSVCNFTALALIGSLASLTSVQSVCAQVIYQDNYTTRTAQGGTIGFGPNVVNVPGGVYGLTYGEGGQGEHLNYADVVAPAGNINYPFQVLDVKTDGGPGFKATVSLPYAATLTGNTDKLKLMFTFRKPTGGVWDFNNLIFGFRGTGNTGSSQNEPGQLDTFFRFESGGYVRAYVPGNEHVSIDEGRLELPGETNATEFGTYSIQYDPLKVSTQPWSLTRPDNVTVDFPNLGGFIDYNPLTQITGVGFGTYSADTNQDRTMWLRDFKFERISQAGSPPIAGDLNSDGFVGQDDLNLILSNWGQSVPPADPLADADDSGFIGQDDLNAVLSTWGQGTPPIEAVPEPATLLLMGLAGVGLAWTQRRRIRRTS